MFRIDRGAASAVDWRVVDETRRVEMRHLHGAGGGPRNTLFRLTCSDRTVPLIGKRSNQATGDGFLYSIQHFGQGPYEKLVFGDEAPYRFSSDTERTELLMLTVEALLVYGEFFNGLDFPDGYVQAQVEIDGAERTYRLSDFGYAGAESSGD